MSIPISGIETKIFDPLDPVLAMNGAELLDPTVLYRCGQWFMICAGQAHGFGPPELFTASLSRSAPLAPGGWILQRDLDGEPIPLTHSLSKVWDAGGGRHCPCYVRGFDPELGQWVERIYYACAAEFIWGPYAIGFLEWNGSEWIDRAQPVFAATEPWELGSVYEPNLIYHDGEWKLWYVSGSNREDRIVHGYSESADGISGWTQHRIFAPPELKLFDFSIRPRGNGFDAVFSRVWLDRQTPPAPETGLWWCRCDTPAPTLAEWSAPVQIMTAEDRGWHSGPFKPSLQFEDQPSGQALIFFSGSRRTGDPGPFPFAFTLGGLRVQLLQPA